MIVNIEAYLLSHLYSSMVVISDTPCMVSNYCSLSFCTCLRFSFTFAEKINVFCVTGSLSLETCLRVCNILFTVTLMTDYNVIIFLFQTTSASRC